jgi:hypothetical protein
MPTKRDTNYALPTAFLTVFEREEFIRENVGDPRPRPAGPDGAIPEEAVIFSRALSDAVWAQVEEATGRSLIDVVESGLAPTVVPDTTTSFVQMLQQGPLGNNIRNEEPAFPLSHGALDLYVQEPSERPFAAPKFTTNRVVERLTTEDADGKRQVSIKAIPSTFTIVRSKTRAPSLINIQTRYRTAS